MTILQIDSSITGEGSVSRQLSAKIVEQLLSQQPDARFIQRDLVASPLSHLTLGGAGDEDVLDEFLDADTVVVGAPMYNFGVPSQLKAWIDRIAVNGRTFLSPQVSAPQLQGARGRNGNGAAKGDIEALPPRQRQILVALGGGRTTKQIAADLGISIKTVETHRARIMEALGCRNAVELLRVAMREHDRAGPAHRAH